jgi:hypothetical protein
LKHLRLVNGDTLRKRLSRGPTRTEIDVLAARNTGIVKCLGDEIARGERAKRIDSNCRVNESAKYPNLLENLPVVSTLHVMQNLRKAPTASFGSVCS